MNQEVDVLIPVFLHISVLFPYGSMYIWPSACVSIWSPKNVRKGHKVLIQKDCMTEVTVWNKVIVLRFWIKELSVYHVNNMTKLFNANFQRVSDLNCSLMHLLLTSYYLLLFMLFFYLLPFSHLYSFYNFIFTLRISYLWINWAVCYLTFRTTYMQQSTYLPWVNVARWLWY